MWDFLVVDFSEKFVWGWGSFTNLSRHKFICLWLNEKSRRDYLLKQGLTGCFKTHKHDHKIKLAARIENFPHNRKEIQTFHEDSRNQRRCQSIYNDQQTISQQTI